MTTVQITLPDELAEKANQAGLLSSESLEEMIRQRLKAKAAKELFSLTEKAQAVPSDEDFSPEAIAEEIKAMRAEKRARLSSV
jgi:post-segregation antitoxin (ccd killing protein)